jgi:hypothetical protein
MPFRERRGQRHTITMHFLAHIGVTRYVTASPLAQKQLLLTKGDNNPVDDIDLYQGLEWLERQHIVGKVRG